MQLEYEINGKTSIFTGWNNGGIGYSFSFLTTQGLISLKHLSVISAQRFPIGAEVYLTTVKWGKSKYRIKVMKNLKVEQESANDDMLYLILFRMRLMLGVTADYLVPTTNAGVTDSYGNRVVAWESIYHIDHRWGASIFVGLNLQFFNYNRNNFQFMLFYSQGIDRKLKIDLDYTRFEGTEYHALLGTRGSYVGIQLAYPIKLKKF